MELENRTPFVLDRLVVLDGKAAEHLVVVLKATYALKEPGQLSVAEFQEPARAADEFYGDPSTTSIKEEAELAPTKPSTDVVLTGSARAPRPGARTMEISFRVGPLAKRIRVFGERRWAKSLGTPLITDPLPFEAIPLTYENAFGGKDTSSEDPSHHDQEPRNPVGRGYRVKRSAAAWVDTPLPSLEDPAHPIRTPDDRVPPQGFGVIARSWEPRARYAGTYDEKWLHERMPLLPLDFDDRFHNAAHPDLVAPGYLSGGEPVEIAGCTASGRLVFNLPRVAPRAEARFSDRADEVPLRLNTVTVNTQAMQLWLLWKGDLLIHRRLPLLRKVRCWLEGEVR